MLSNDRGNLLTWRSLAGKYVFTVLVALLVVSCARSPTTDPGPPEPSQTEEQTRAILEAQEASWKGVKYALGGQSRSGIDCSGFVQLTFRDKFGVELPRDTDGQSSFGTKIDRSDMRVGDLIFFHTTETVNHVGIFMGEKSFLHASTSKGPIISSLDNSYWKTRWWQARRVL